jgi:hypothetical protein
MTRCYTIILCMITSRSKWSLFFLDPKPWRLSFYLQVSYMILQGLMYILYSTSKAVRILEVTVHITRDSLPLIDR